MAGPIISKLLTDFFNEIGQFELLALRKIREALRLA